MKRILFQILFAVLLLTGCASSKLKQKQKNILASTKTLKNHNLNQVLIFADNSGKFSIKRSLKNQGNKLLFQRMIYEDDFSKFLERSRSVSVFNQSLSEENVLRPMVSQFKAWFDGQEYSNQIKFSYSKREVEVLTQSKESKYPASQKFSLPPDNKKLCFFYMVTECMKLWGVPEKVALSPSYETWFYVIMDAYPFLDLIYNEIPNKWITEATLVYDGFKDKEHQFSLELHDQIISLKFNEKWDFVAMYWVSQGISMVTN